MIARLQALTGLTPSRQARARMSAAPWWIPPTARQLTTPSHTTARSFHRPLTSAGFGSVEIRPFDAVIGGADIEQTLKLALRLGPLGRALREQPGSADAVAGAVGEALSRYVTSDGVLMRRGLDCSGLQRFNRADVARELIFPGRIFNVRKPRGSAWRRGFAITHAGKPLHSRNR